VLAMAASLAIADLNSVFALLILTIPLIVGVFYSVKISSRLPRLKEVTGAKSILVALSWSVTGSLLPLSTQAVDLQRVCLVFSYVFIQVLVNTVLFDVLDTKGDLVTGIKTIPALLGLGQTRVFLMLANSALILWIAFCFADGLFLRFLPALLFGVMYGYGIICYFMRKNSRRISADIFIDGQWLLILPLMKII
jgi:4-hydroxybenzoate polyprenyltransferase